MIAVPSTAVITTAVFQVRPERLRYCQPRSLQPRSFNCGLNDCGTANRGHYNRGLSESASLSLIVRSSVNCGRSDLPLIPIIQIEASLITVWLFALTLTVLTPQHRPDSADAREDGDFLSFGAAKRVLLNCDICVDNFINL